MERAAVVLGHIQSSPGQLNATPVSSSTTVSFHRRGILTSDMIESYEENGYFVIKKLVGLDRLEKYRQRFVQLCRKEETVPGLTMMKDISLQNKGATGEKLINKIQDFQYDDQLFDYCMIPEVVKYVRAVVESDNVMGMHTMLINKPPDSGDKTSRHPMHQDLHYFPFRPADRIVCSWTAMEKVSRSNGCLVVIPGSHKGPLLVHDYPKWQGGVNKMYHGILDYDPSAPRIYLEMDPGDTVFFHPLLIHGSGTNVTKGYRKAISCHYAASECFYIDVQGTSQELIRNEVLELVRRRFGDELKFSFEDAWKYRGRVICGDRINL